MGKMENLIASYAAASSRVTTPNLAGRRADLPDDRSVIFSLSFLLFLFPSFVATLGHASCESIISFFFLFFFFFFFFSPPRREPNA